jgi:hypothetical protein
MPEPITIEINPETVMHTYLGENILRVIHAHERGELSDESVDGLDEDLSGLAMGIFTVVANYQSRQAEIHIKQLQEARTQGTPPLEQLQPYIQHEFSCWGGRNSVCTCGLGEILPDRKNLPPR